MKAQGLNRQELATQIKVKVQNLYKWIQKGAEEVKPQEWEDKEKLEKWFFGKVEHVPQETGKNSTDITDQALLNLAISEKDRSAAEKDRAAAELIREENNRKIINHLTASSRPESSQALDAMLPGLKNILIQLGVVAKAWTEEEGTQGIDKWLYGTVQKIEVKGSRNDLGKKRTNPK